jgi:hypothetical protein
MVLVLLAVFGLIYGNSEFARRDSSAMSSVIGGWASIAVASVFIFAALLHVRRHFLAHSLESCRGPIVPIMMVVVC